MLEAGAGGSREIAPAAAATIDGDSLRLDFDGTEPQVEGNLNCPLSVTRTRRRSSPSGCSPTPTRRPRPAPTARSRWSRPRAPAQRAAAGRGRRRQRRDLEPGRRPGHRGARRRHAGAGPGPGDDEQPDPRGRGRSPTTRRSAAARAPARTPTGRAPSTWRCRTPSTRRSRRSRPSSRCGSGSWRSAAAAAAAAPPRRRRDRARARGARADALHPDHRAPPHAPRGRDGGADGRPGATCSTATSCRQVRRAGSRPATGCGSRRPAAVGTGPPVTERKALSQTWNCRRDPSLDCVPSAGLACAPVVAVRPGPVAHRPNATNTCLLPSKSGP